MKQYSRSRAQITLKASLGIEFIRAFDCFFQKKIFSLACPPKSPTVLFLEIRFVCGGQSSNYSWRRLLQSVQILDACLANKIFFVTSWFFLGGGAVAWVVKQFFGGRGGSECFKFFLLSTQQKKKKLDENIFERSRNEVEDK